MDGAKRFALGFAVLKCPRGLLSGIDMSKNLVPGLFNRDLLRYLVHAEIPRARRTKTNLAEPAQRS